MKITDLEIEGYGVWSGLRIEKFGDSLNVLYGPNEAGKTTLLQFIRAMLYGFSPERRRYLPPVHGEPAGGVMDLSGPHGRFEIGRHDRTLPDGAHEEQVTLTAPDGTRQGEHFLKVLLSNVDEPVFNNVFAVGLREIQELATLSDTEAAEQLYNLSAGLDRVSLVEVLRELENSRNRILDAGGGPCQVAQLLAEKEKIRAEIEELESVNRRYGHLAAEYEQLQQNVMHVEEDANQLQRLARVMDLALSLRDRWTRRAALDNELVALGPSKAMPEDAAERFDAINERIEKHQKRIEHFARERDAAKREFASLKINEALWRQAARIEAFKEQGPWIAQLQKQIGELRDEIGRTESELAAEGKRLGVKSIAEAMPTFSAKSLASLRSPANALRQCRRRCEEASKSLQNARETADSLTKQIESALLARGETDLTAAMDRAGSLVLQFRRRAQFDERLDQLGRYQTELEEQSRQLVDRQLLPVGVLIGLGAVFVVGVMLIFTGLFMPASITGTIGLTLAVLGLAGSAAAAGGKVMLERSNAHRLDGCQKQLGMLQLQMQQATADRDALDAQLPRGGGPIVSRLQAAEQELAALEELTPLDTRRGAARQEAEAAQRREAESREELSAMRRRWRDSLSNVGLPNDLNPKQVQWIAQHADRITDTRRRLAERREDLVRRERELEALKTRISQLAADAGVSLDASDPAEQLQRLAEAAARQEAGAARRDILRTQVRRLRAARAKHEAAVSRGKHRRRALLLEAGVKDEQEFRRHAMECGRAVVLQRDRDTIAREIESALTSQCSEDAIRKQLENEFAASLEARRAELGRQTAVVERQLHGLIEQRGRLSEQLETLASDRRMASKQLDLAVVEKRLADAIHRWQTLATTCQMLDVIRDTYEHERQPETLQEASGYLDRLTQGRYHRVWTPLGEHSLRVDDSDGHSLAVESLSRGTREQLFLSLRLALASSYAKRGAPLPLVLDDVLVNYDAERAKAAAAVLRDFAAAGHQLLVFTCHEHIMKMFQSLHVPVSQLPNNAEPGRIVMAAVVHAEEKPAEQREVVARPPRRKIAAKAKLAAVESLPEKKPEEEAKPEAVATPVRKQQPTTSKKHATSSGVFDADFYDSQDDDDDEEDEEEDADDDGDMTDEEIEDASWNADEEPYEDYNDGAAAA